jgi:ectoine hydroxylase-related dioxygenase (phytanoyl-CoA dioxygenase family)
MKLSRRNNFTLAYRSAGVLKFYINLTDVDEGNGAFRYDVGSHREGQLLANYQILSGVAVGKIKNDVPDAFIRNPLVINAKAGDLVVFDAAGYHKAGTVQKERQRMMARGHSHPLPILGYTSKPWGVHWWVASIFNPFRW